MVQLTARSIDDFLAIGRPGRETRWFIAESQLFWFTFGQEPCRNSEHINLRCDTRDESAESQAPAVRGKGRICVPFDSFRRKGQLPSFTGVRGNEVYCGRRVRSIVTGNSQPFAARMPTQTRKRSSAGEATYILPLKFRHLAFSPTVGRDHHDSRLALP